MYFYKIGNSGWNRTSARLGRVTPLGRPKSVYKNDVERRFLQFQMAKLNDPHLLSMQAERIPRCIFGANLLIFAQIHYNLSRRQAKFPRLLSHSGQKNLEDQGQWPPLQIPPDSIPGCMFGANLVIPAHICDELSYRKLEFPGRLSQMTKITLKVKVNDPHFQYQLRLSHDACLVKIRWSSSNLWWVIVKTR